MAIHSKADHRRPWRGNNNNRVQEKDDGTRRLPPDLDGGRQTGVVIRWFNDKGLGKAGNAGFGWIDPDDGSSQLFCHNRQIEGLTKDGNKARSIVEGTRVEYVPVVAERDPSKFEAVNVTGVKNKPLPVYARGEIAGFREGGHRPDKVLTVTNISYWVTEQELREHFEQVGRVVVVKLQYEGGYKGKGKKSLGRATVRMHKQTDANKAEWQLHKTMLRDRMIYVQARYRLHNKLDAEKEAKEALFNPQSGVYNNGQQLQANWNEETVDEMYEDLPPLLEWT
jgi:cold shock CspA family protein